MADSGEWKCFHNITHESQRALAEMNETLGSLRQWNKQRRVDLSPAPTRLEDAPTAVVTGEQLLSEENPSTHLDCSSELITTLTSDSGNLGVDSANACGRESFQSVLDKDTLGDGQEDPLLILWQVAVDS